MAYATAAELQAAVDEYFDAVDRYNEAAAEGARLYYTFEGLLLHLGLSESEVRDWELADPARAEVMQRAVRRLADALQQLALNTPNRSSFVVFCLRQWHYGGYADRSSEPPGPVKIEIRVTGDKGEDPFL